MKKAILILVLIFLSMGIGYPEVLAKISGIYKLPRLFIDENQFYVYDLSTCIFDIYSLKDYQKIKSFGKKGEGPGEFNINPNAHVYDDYIFGSNTGKVMYFSKSGELIREIKIPTTLGRIKALGKRIAGQYHDPNRQRPKPGKQKSSYKYKVLTPGKDDWNDVYTFSHFGMVYVAGTPMREFMMMNPLAWAHSDGEFYIIGDPTKGLYFCFIDESGNIVKELNIPYEKQKVTNTVKNRVLAERKKVIGDRWEEYQKKVKHVFPEFVPPYSNFKLDKPRIMAKTFYTEVGKQEYIVVDYDGNFLKKILLPSGHPHTFHRGKMYYLVEKEEYSELHVIDVI